ncbi:hypothetical protein V6N13_014835 [Hibiscus sabdariffa]
MSLSILSSKALALQEPIIKEYSIMFISKACKKPLEGNEDIFLCRDFCSEECRQEQLDIDESKDKSLAFACFLASAFDPSPLQDFCVAINDPTDAGLNTLGISLVRIDYAPYGENPPHTHPRGTEILVVVQGTLYVGFVTSNPENRLITKILYPGDVFVFPIGLIHFQYNLGNTPAVAFAGLSSQNAGVITIANAVFGSNPPINLDVLTKAFQLDKNVVTHLQSIF